MDDTVHPLREAGEETAEYVRLSGADALMLRMERGSAYNHTLKIAILDPSSDPDGWSYERCREWLAYYVSVVAMMRKRYLPTPLGLHEPIWVPDPEFELDAHLRRVSCPAPGTMRQFCTLVEQIYAHPLDHQRPLWQIWVVEGLEGGRVGVVLLIHHAYSDGAGIAEIIDNITAKEPVDLPDEASRPWKSTPLPSATRRLLWGIRDLPRTVRALPPALWALRELVKLERQFAAHSDTGKRPSQADKRKPQMFGGLLTRVRHFACESFALDDLLTARAGLGGTINDVFLCCVAGGVREFLESRGLPNENPIVGVMPMVTKPVAERPTLGGNFSAADNVWLHPEVAESVQRLAVTRVSAQATKDHYRAVMAKTNVYTLAGVIPGGVINALLRLNRRTEGRYFPMVNAIASNVRGPAEMRYLGRWRMDRWFSTGQLVHGATVNFTGWSYAQQFNLCVLSGSPMVSDPWELIGGFRNTLAALVAAARKTVEQSASARNRESV
jgi:WS/DGAT/MGAT family acyltransferase